MRASFRSAVLAFATLTLSAIPAGARQACASNHVQAKLSVFSEGSVSLPLYWAVESDGQATFTIQILDSSCDGSTVTISYEVQDGSAQSPADYTFADSGQVAFVNSVGHPTKAEKSVNITNDLLGAPLDAAVEFGTVELTGMQGGRLIAPTSAPLAIVDDDGPTARVSLLEGPYEESESTPNGGVPVFRGGSASGTTSVDYAIGGGTATPGADYEGPTTGTLTFPPDSRMELIPITIVDDAEQEPPETMEVSISGPDVDPQGTSSVTFIITDNEERFPPTSRLHHPRQDWKYRASDFRIREVHIFTEDEGGAGVVDSEFALRRNLKDRSCGWWSGKKFKKGDCKKERWLKTGEYETDFFYIRLKELKPSTGSIRNYTAYSRAIDGAKNLEADFEVGRNANTFEVKKPKK